MDGNLDAALKLYEENARLSEAFYTPLQNLEIALRNSLADNLTQTFGADWPLNGKPKFNNFSLRMIQEVTDSGINDAAGAMIAELKLAFWVGLIGRDYDATLWRQSLHSSFRNGGAKPRRIVHSRFNALRRFRNRIMHHEPIFDRPLQQLHDEIIEAIGWICPETAAWTAHHSRFQTVLTTA